MLAVAIFCQEMVAAELELAPQANKNRKKKL